MAAVLEFDETARRGTYPSDEVTFCSSSEARLQSVTTGVPPSIGNAGLPRCDSSRFDGARRESRPGCSTNLSGARS
jgi:hypothetical protein